MYWWIANKRQQGRGNISVSRITQIPVLDTRTLTDQQHAQAKRIFDEFADFRFLPFDQIDRDPARAALDRAVLVELLGLPAELCEAGGTIDLLRRKLAAEPQIHGGKLRDVVFTEDGETTVARDL